jgi:hypothetical protein
MVGTVLGTIGALAGIAWLSAVVHALLLIPHRQDHVSAFQLVFQGYRFYQAGTWKESGRALHRRLLLSAAAFAVLLIAEMLLSLVLLH